MTDLMTTRKKLEQMTPEYAEVDLKMKANESILPIIIKTTIQKLIAQM